DRTNILAPGFWSGIRRTHLLPAFTAPLARGDWPMRKSYPVTAAQLLPIRTGFLAPIHFFKLAKNWDRGLAACALSFKIYLSIRNYLFSVSSTDSSLNLIITGGAGFIGSNLTLALQEKFPDA